jgi:hypothetical protein
MYYYIFTIYILIYYYIFYHIFYCIYITIYIAIYYYILLYTQTHVIVPSKSKNSPPRLGFCAAILPDMYSKGRVVEGRHVKKGKKGCDGRKACKDRKEGRKRGDVGRKGGAEEGRVCWKEGRKEGTNLAAGKSTAVVYFNLLHLFGVLPASHRFLKKEGGKEGRTEERTERMMGGGGGRGKRWKIGR